MAMTQSEIERQLTQHGADIEAIYDIVSDMQKTLKRHDARYDRIDRRLDGIDGRLDAHDRRFDTLDATLAEVLRRLPEPPV
jgi:septal ring factor EnvC (AmiA/AmiB activator)